MIESSGEMIEEQKLSNEVFTRIRANGADFPFLRRCIKCRVCEKRCTQKIDISQRMEILSKLAEEHGYTLDLMQERLQQIEKSCIGKRAICIWPAADYASRVFDFWKNEEFEKRCIYFNASDAVIGSKFRGKIVLGPDEIENSGVETIVIMHHRLQKQIYQDLVKKVGSYERKVEIIRLHKDTDVDWFNRMI